jgi:hypothetical protein
VCLLLFPPSLENLYLIAIVDADMFLIVDGVKDSNSDVIVEVAKVGRK